MPRGTNTNSGPTPDPNSLKSARRGLAFTALPAEGYAGETPPYPLPKVPVYDIYFEDKKRVKELDQDATDDRFERELELWAWAWRTPQAAMWAAEPWRQHPVALWVRTAAICEGSDATAADKNSLHRFADQIGLTPAGLAFNGWKIASNQVAEKRSEKVAPTIPAAPGARDRWLKAVGGDA
jgi:hypothetical protein